MESYTLLLADDDSDDIEIFREALSLINPAIRCHTAINGKEALKTISEMSEKPHLIFLDVNMPVMNGWQCLNQLKQQDAYRDIPVFVISTSSHQRELNTVMETGALGYLTKPSNFNTLKDLLQVIVSNIGPGLQQAMHELQAGGSGYVYVSGAKTSGGLAG